MTTYFQYTTAKQNIGFLLLWIVGHVIATIFQFFMIPLFDPMPGWVITTCFYGLLPVLGFAFTQGLNLGIYWDSHQIDVERWLGISALMAIIGGFLGGLVVPLLDQSLPETLRAIVFCAMFALLVLPAALGQWWILRRDVRRAWLWPMVWMLTFAAYGLFWIAFFDYVFDSDIFVFGLLSFPACILISGVTMLFLINSPRIGKEKRKNEML
jgi:hypothetical protein